jgi:hypothetical protein
MVADFSTKCKFFSMSDEELLILNAQGFIPGPSETEELFLSRVKATRAAFATGEWIPRPHWDWVRAHLKEIFDFEPHCLPAFYSNRGLSPWQGAASWIEGGRVTSVQLREALKKGSYLGYTREEILAHEAVHAARSAFEEPKSEEFFAYTASEKAWRRVLGPIVQRPWEVWVLLIAMPLGWVTPWGYLLSAAMVGAGFWRLARQHWRLRQASERLMRELGDLRRVRSLLFRLTDREIDLFARGEDLMAYAKRQECLRWRLIRLAYLNKE